MSKLKISELFYSVQGEGRYMGVPSVFLRTFGCNFTCDGFGMPKGEKSNERNVIAVKAEDYTDYKSLPLVSTGCDSYASWDPRFKHLSPVLSVDTISDSIISLLPGNKWGDSHLVITGGEPLLGWQRAYPDLLSLDNMRSLQELTFETNGTQPLSDELTKYMADWKKHRVMHSLTFSVSPKLSISGESWEDAICPDVIAQYYNTGYTYLKFVVATKEDAEEAEQAVNEYRKRGFKGPVYLMPCGGVESVYSMNNRTVAELAIQKGWRYSDRLQVPLFKNEWGT
jgi:organic radical activating enzyme